MSATVSIWLLSCAVGFSQADVDSIDVIAPGATLEKVWGEEKFTGRGSAGSGRFDLVFRHRRPGHAV